MVEKLVPLPQRVDGTEGAALRLGSRWCVAVPSEESRALGETVAGLLERLHGVATFVRVGGGGDLNLMLAQLGPEPAGDAGEARGIDPLDEPDGLTREAYALTVTQTAATVTAPTAEGLFRGATTFAQLIGTDRAVAPVEVADGPAWAWRGLSLDVARRFFTVAEVKRVVDLLALYKFNVLHLHLTDSQGWRLEMESRPRLADGDFYTRDDYREIVAYAAARFVTVVPEIDMPGHTHSVVRAYPALRGETVPAHELVAFLDPRAEDTPRFVADVLGELAALTPGPYLHIGGDEAFGMPPEQYAEFVAMSLEAGRATGKKVVAWQEAARSGGLRPDDVAQCWIGEADPFDAEALRERAAPEYHALIDLAAEAFEESANDVPAAVAGGVPVLASPKGLLYLDRQYAEDSLLADQTARRTKVGFRDYEPRTSRELFAWSPGTLTDIPADARVAGVEAAVWCETVKGFDDLAFLLLPRLPAIAEKAWTRGETAWEDYRGRVAPHAPWWERLGWNGYYRSSEVFGR